MSAKDLLIREFNIPTNATDRTWKGLANAWNKYLLCKQTLRAANNLQASWPVYLPRYSETLIIEIFIGKTTWHENYLANFSKVEDNYPDMVMWLELAERSATLDKEVWGYSKATYTFQDLAEWINHQERAKDKGKGKERKKEKRRSSSGSGSEVAGPSGKEKQRAVRNR